MENSKIAWTTHTFNPWRGCTKVSEGCKNCYAETMSGRNPKTLGVWGPQGTRVIASLPMWKEPVKWNSIAELAADLWKAVGGEPGETGTREYKGTKCVYHGRPRVFCASLADVFEGEDTMPQSAWEAVRQARVRLWHLISETPYLDWLLLTKRPENVLAFPKAEKRSWTENMPGNVWMGTTVENQEMADKRIPHLLEIPAKVRFLSVEPQLGPIELADWTPINSAAGYFPDIHWVICGGESGGHARPLHLEWARSLRDQCKAAGVAYFMKQMGSHLRWMPKFGGCGIWPDHVRFDYQANGEESSHRIHLRHSKGEDMAEWPADLQIQEFPKGGVK